MNFLIILGHPDQKSFNHALAEACTKRLEKHGHQVFFHDLYKENFNPLHLVDNADPNQVIEENIQKHCKELRNSDGIIIIHPDWWGQPPAIVKGWIDRVLLPDVAYKFIQNENGEIVPKGLLKAKVAIVLNTCNTAEDLSTIDPLEIIWKNRVFKLCGVQNFERYIFRVIKTSDLNERKIWLQEVEAVIDRYFSDAHINAL